MEARATRSRSTKDTKPTRKKAATPRAENSHQSIERRALRRRIDNDYLDGKPVSAAARGATVATKVDRVALLGLNHVVDPDAGIEDLMTEVICHLQAAHQIGELVSAELYDVGSQMAANPRDASVVLGGLNSLVQVAIGFTQAAMRRALAPVLAKRHATAQ